MTADFKRPIDAVHEALPGTIGDLVERTGYPAGTIMGLIVRLRSEGVRVNAVEDGVSRNGNRFLDPENPHTSTTVFVVDSRREMGVE